MGIAQILQYIWDILTFTLEHTKRRHEESGFSQFANAPAAKHILTDFSKFKALAAQSADKSQLEIYTPPDCGTMEDDRTNLMDLQFSAADDDEVNDLIFNI